MHHFYCFDSSSLARCISVHENVFKGSHNRVKKLHDSAHTVNALDPPCLTHIYQNKVVGSRNQCSNLADQMLLSLGGIVKKFREFSYNIHPVSNKW